MRYKSNKCLRRCCLPTQDMLLITHVSKYLQVGTYPVRTSRYLPLAKSSTYLVTTKLGRTQQYTLLIAITLAMSSTS